MQITPKSPPNHPQITPSEHHLWHGCVRPECKQFCVHILRASHDACCLAPAPARVPSARLPHAHADCKSKNLFPTFCPALSISVRDEMFGNRFATVAFAYFVHSTHFRPAVKYGCCSGVFVCSIYVFVVFFLLLCLDPLCYNSCPQ